MIYHTPVYLKTMLNVIKKLDFTNYLQKVSTIARK